MRRDDARIALGLTFAFIGGAVAAALHVPILLFALAGFFIGVRL